MITLTPSCADCLQIWEHQPPGILRDCTGTASPLFQLRVPRRDSSELSARRYSTKITQRYVTQKHTSYAAERKHRNIRNKSYKAKQALRKATRSRI